MERREITIENGLVDLMKQAQRYDEIRFSQRSAAYDNFKKSDPKKKRLYKVDKETKAEEPKEKKDFK